MRLDDIKESKNVEDRRFNNVGRTKVGRGKGGILTFIIVLVGAYYGVDLTGLMGGGVEYEEQTSALNESEEKQLRTLSVEDQT